MVVIVSIVLAPVAMIIAISVAVPAMIVLVMAVRAIPVPSEIARAVMMRPNPDRALVRRAAPIAFMPPIMAFHRIPVALYPDKPGAWHRRLHDDSRRRRRADLNSNRDIRCQG